MPDGLAQCRWFTRGWTLQELIAPRYMTFFDAGWNVKGYKHELIEPLAKITGIEANVLSHQKPLDSVCVAQKMCWASRRQTTRVEDTAYCLLGIFGVNMPMIYGEEEKAFRRLQHEIIRSTQDVTIFAWILSPHSGDSWAEFIKLAQGNNRYCGMFAESPRDFVLCQGVQGYVDGDMTSDFYPTSEGIKTRARLLIQPTGQGQDGNRYIFPVCSQKLDRFGVVLRKCGPNRFVRQDPQSLYLIPPESFYIAPKEIYLATSLHPQSALGSRVYGDNTILLGRPTVLQLQLPRGFEVNERWPWSRWDDNDSVFFLGNVHSNRSWSVAGITGTISFKMNQGSYDIGWHNSWSFKVAFTIFAAGWQASGFPKPQYTIFDHHKSDTIRLMDTARRLEDMDPDYNTALAMARWAIPCTKTVEFPVPNEMDLILRVLVKAELMPPDKRICLNPFWRLVVSPQVWRRSEAPMIHVGSWDSVHDPSDEMHQVNQHMPVEVTWIDVPGSRRDVPMVMSPHPYSAVSRENTF